METKTSRAARISLAIIALAGWFALIAQFYLILETKRAPAAELVMRFFTYYTILTNILVALCSTAIALKGFDQTRFFTRPGTITAITVNITIVGIVYNIVLRGLAEPQGLARMVDEMLHLIIPLAFLLSWFLFVPKGGLQWKSVWLWLIYPLSYFLVVLIRGSIASWYPYHFIDINILGYGKALLNASGLTIGFILISLMFIWIDKLMFKRALK